jgi:hypothetical protein
LAAVFCDSAEVGDAILRRPTPIPWAAAIPVMGHFEREAKLNLALLVIPIVIGLVATLIGVFVFHAIDSVRIDQCLDRGGSYNYGAGKCDFAESHPSPE